MTVTNETLDMFAGAVSEIANGPKVTSFQDLTEGLLRRLSEKGLTLAQCADRRMLNRAKSTLQAHCAKFGIKFPDYCPPNMRTQLRFVQRGDFAELSGDHVDAVASALQVVITERNGIRSIGLPSHSFADSKKALRIAGFEARKVKAPKPRKEAVNA